MKRRNIYAICALLGFLCWLGVNTGCGPTVNEEGGEGIVFDTVPVFEKDTFMYPLATRSSSYMFPEVFFGEVKTIDGDLGSAWQTIPGLVTGEYIEFDFDSLYIGGLEIFTSSEIRFSKIKNIKIFAEGKLLGIYTLERRIPINRKINTLKIELGETEGINKVDIPFKIDSTTNIQPKSITAESIYASKSAAIFEFVFFDEKGKGIPLRSLQVKKAKMNFYGIAEPQQMNNSRLLFDGRKGFGWRGTNESKEKTLLFSFSEDQIINGLFFPFTDNLNITRIGFRLRKRSLPEYDVVYKRGNGIFIPLKNTLKGKNFELVILKTKNNEAPFIPELLFHDGSRLFSIYSDSLELYQKQRLDSSQNNPLGNYIDGRVVTKTDRTEYNHPLNIIFAKKKMVKDTLPNKSIQIETTFRLCSNGTFLVNEIRTEQTFGKENSSNTHTKFADGYWLIKSKSPEEATITCYSDLKETVVLFRPGKESAERTSVKSVTFNISLVLNHVTFSDYFTSMTTGY